MTREPDTADPTPATAPKTRRWPRRLRRLALVVLVLLVVARIALPLALPSLLERWAEGEGLSCVYERLDLSLLTGDIELWHLALADRETQRPLAYLEYCRLDAAMLDLLRGKLVVRRAEVDGLDVHLVRDPDGQWNLRTGKGKTAGDEQPDTDEEPEPEEPAEPSAPAPYDFSLPLSIDALRLQHLRLAISDPTAEPPLEVRIDTQVRVSNLASSDRPLRIEITTASPELVDHVAIEASVRAEPRDLEARVDVRVRDLRLAPATAHLEQLGLRPVGGPLSFDLSALVTAEVLGEAADALAARLELRDVALREGGHEHLVVDHVDVDVARLSGTGTHVQSVEIQGVRGLATRTDQGVLRVAGLELVPAPPRESPPDSTPEPTTPDTPSTFQLGEVNAGDLAFEFQDHALPDSPTLSVEIPELRVTDLGDPAQPARMAVTVGGPGLVESLRVTGALELGESGQSADLSIDMEGLTLAALQPYLAPAGVRTEFESGQFSAALVASHVTDEDSTRLTLAVENVSLRDGDELLSLRSLAVPSVTLGPAGTHVGTIAVTGLRASAVQDDDGLHVAGVCLGTPPPAEAEPDPDPSASPPQEPETASSSSPSPEAGSSSGFELDGLVLSDHRLLFVDRTVAPPRELELTSLDLETGALRLGTPGTERATPVRLRASLPALFGALELDGEVLLAGERIEADVNLALRQIAPDLVQPSLVAAGLDDHWEDGSLEVSVGAQVEIGADQVDASAEVTGLSVRDGRSERFGMERLALEGVTLRTRPDPATPEGLPDLCVQEFSLAGGRLELRGDFATEPLSLGFEAGLRELDLSVARRSPFHLALAIPGAVEALRVEGGVLVGAASRTLDLTLSGTDIRTDALEELLPDTIQGALADGQLAASLRVSVDDHPDGGLALDLAMSDVSLREGDHSLFGVDLVRVQAPRVDPESGHILVGEVSLAGLECEARRTADGRMQALGMILGGAAASTTEPVAEEPTGEAARDPAVDLAEESAPETPASDPTLVEKPSWPEVTLERLDLELRRLTWIDEAQESAGLDVGVRLTSAAPLMLLAEDLEALDPWRLVVDAQVPTLVESAHLELSASPYQIDPQVELLTDVSGINLARLPEVLPALAEQIQGSDVEQGHFTMRVQVELMPRRRDPMDFDLSRGFGCELNVEELHLRESRDGPVLAGIDRVFAEVTRVEPDSGAVQVRTLEIDRPIARVRKDEEGTHVLGLLLAEPVEGEPAPGEAGETEPTEPVEPTPAPEPAPPAGEPAPGPDQTIERLYVTGLDVRVEDRTVEPAFVLPLTELDVEVRNLTTRALRKRERVRYSVLLGSDQVALPGSDDPRPLFGEVTVRGEVFLSPELEGWTRIGASGLELTGFQGHAATAGVTIGGGSLDLSTLLGFPGDGRLVTDVSAAFVDLDLDEAADGPISRYLKLPAPLNVVLMLLRDESGTITVPLNLEMEDGEVGTGQLAAAGVSAFGLIVADAIASSPFRILGTVGDVASLVIGEEEEEPAEVTYEVDFRVGQALAPARRLAELDELLELLDDDEELAVTLVHELGREDQALLQRRANPSPADCRELITTLRQHRRELLAGREVMRDRIRVAHQAGLPEEAADLQVRIAATDRQLGQIERSLDHVALLLTRTAPTHGQRRTRQACLTLAYQRVAAVRQWLLEALGPEQAGRIRLRRPKVREATRDGGGCVVIEVVTTRSG